MKKCDESYLNGSIALSVVVIGSSLYEGTWDFHQSKLILVWARPAYLRKGRLVEL